MHTFFYTILVEWGDYLFLNLKNEIILYILVISLIIFSILVLKIIFKVNFRIIILTELIFLLLSFLFFIIPYSKGEKLEHLKSFGMRIVTEIKKYELNKNHLPFEINDLYPEFINKDTFDSSRKCLTYSYFNHYEINRNTQTNFEKDFFTLTIYEDFMGFYYLAYKEKQNKFIFTDE